MVPVAVAALLLVSGCTGAFAGDDAPSEPTTADTVSHGDAALPPGVTESGVTNATALLAAHSETLRTEGFVLDGLLVRNHSATRSERRQYSAVVAPGAERFRMGVEVTLYASTSDSREVVQQRATRLWSDGRAVIRRTTLDDRTSRSRVDGVPTNLALTRRPQYESYLSLGDYDVERVERRGDHTCATLVADETRADFEGNATIDARFVVDERGVVHEAEVTLRSGSGESTETDRATYRLVQLGGSPERPDWANETTE